MEYEHVFRLGFNRCRYCNLTEECLLLRHEKNDHSRDKCTRPFLTEKEREEMEKENEK